MTAKVPAVPDYSSPDPGLGRWVSAVNSAFKALRDAGLMTEADINDLARKAREGLGTKRAPDARDVVVDVGGGLSGVIPISDLVSKLLQNQQFNDAIKSGSVTSTPAASTGSDMMATLEQGVSDAAKSAAEAAKLASRALTGLSQVKATTRGPIRSTGVASSWNDTTAAQCIYWMQYNGGTGSPPSFPSGIEDYLVVGDRVAMRDSVSGPSTWFEAKQWLGSTIGWVVTPNSEDFNDVINLATFLANVSAVINSSLQLVGSTVIAGTGRTLTQVASYRAPIINVCHVGGGTGVPVALDPDVASWTVLYILNGYVNPGFRAGMPTAYLIYGDTITFIDDGIGSAIGALSWNGSAWV